jgi:hypothetical protein
MPRQKKDASKPLPANKQKGKKICSCCTHEKNVTDFYLSYSPMYSLDKRVPVCKECCKSSALNSDGTINYEKLKELLRNIDKPLYIDLLLSSEQSISKENSYLDEDEIQYHGKEILQKYFTLIAMRQDRAKSYTDSENEGFLHQNNNRSNEEKNKILNKYGFLIQNVSKAKIEQYSSETQSSKTVKWSKKDKQNTKYVMSVVGYDPFEDMNLSDYDKKYCFNILAGYCDAEGISEDGHKIQCVVQLTNLYCQCRKIDETINLELSKEEVDETKISKLTSSKSSILSSIATIAKDNNIASNYNKNSTQGKNTLSAKMKEIVADGFEDMKVNLFDINTSACMKQIADLSNQSIMEQLTFDSNEYTEMIKEQREMIVKFQNENDRLEEENRILKNQIQDLENKKR